MINLLEKLIGCKHENMTFPMGKFPKIHVCCITCGREFPYDWKAMRVLPAVPRKKVVQMVRNVLTERE